MTENTRTPVSDWDLERYLLGELPGARNAEIEEEIRQNPELQRKLDALQRSNEEILEAMPPRVAAAAIRQRFEKHQEKEKRAPSWLKTALPVGAAAMLALFVVVVGDFGGSGSHPDEVFRQNGETIYTKGAKPRLALYRKTPGAYSEKLQENQVVSEGDTLQLAYVAAGARYGTLLSIDGRGSVTLHFPTNEAGSLELSGKGEIRLPFAYELDDAPRFERFFLVTSQTPFDLAQVLASAKKCAADSEKCHTQALELPENVNQVSFLLGKNSN